MLHYVYQHYENDEVVYVGMGTGGRCWDTHGSRRNSEHKAWMLSQLPYLKYSIVFTSTDRNEVLSWERKLIKELNPKFNIGHKRTLSPSEVIARNERISKINKQQKHCTHCNHSFGLGMYSRWHGDNCKQKGK